MTNEVSPDLLELFEYDEFDSYDEHTYQAIAAAKETASDGIPLSVELSESLHNSQSDEQNSGFVKAPEIFLRIESNIENKTKRSNSLESSDSNIVIPVANGDDIECFELQYENEFDDQIDETDIAHSSCQPNSCVETEYEQLLFEGINQSVCFIRILYFSSVLGNNGSLSIQ